MLATLPGVGKKMAQMMVAELKGKLITFAVESQAEGLPRVTFATYQTEALEILIGLG